MKYNPLASDLWRCPATEHAEPADRGHRFQSIFRADPRDGDLLFCERCGITRKVPREEEAE